MSEKSDSEAPNDDVEIKPDDHLSKQDDDEHNVCEENKTEEEKLLKEKVMLVHQNHEHVCDQAQEYKDDKEQDRKQDLQNNDEEQQQQDQDLLRELWEPAPHHQHYIQHAPSTVSAGARMRLITAPQRPTVSRQASAAGRAQQRWGQVKQYVYPCIPTRLINMKQQICRQSCRTSLLSWFCDFMFSFIYTIY